MNVAREKMKDLLLNTPINNDDYMTEISMFDIKIDQITVSPYFLKTKRITDGIIRYSCNCRMQIIGTHDITTDKFYENIDDVLLNFEHMLQYKFVGPYCLGSNELFVSPQKYENIKTKYEYIYAIQEKEFEECYVCYEPTYGHKTTCRHDICAHCFLKCTKACDDCGEEHTDFECGMCKTIVSFCDDCEDEDEDKYDDDDVPDLIEE